MKTNFITLLLSFSWLTLLVSSSNAVAIDNFIQCLSTQINHSIPIQDSIFTPKNTTFQQVLQTYIKNRRFLTPKTPKPLAIVTPLHVSHIQATITCAKDHSLQIRIRSGGHDFEGISYRANTSFVILDMFNLRSIDIDIASETAWVESGAILGELYYKISKVSKVHAFPAGVCSSLGVGGHFSGGGYGNMMRKYGLSVDNVVDAKIVDYNGNVYDRKSMGEDLFWAIRGGGGGSFGVILSWKIKLVRVPSMVTVFKVPRTLEQGGTDIFYKWQQVATEIDNELYIRAQPEIQNPKNEIQNPKNETEKKTVRISFIGQFLGQKSKLLTLVQNKFPELGLQAEDCIETTWVESGMFWDNFPTGTPTEAILNRTVPASIFFKTKSDYVKQIISKSDLENIWTMFMKTEGMLMQWNPYGGRMKEISDTKTAFPHRAGYLFKVQYLTMWFVDGEEVEENHMKLAREMYEGMAKYVSKNPREAFLNYRDLDIGSNPSNETKLEEAEIYGHKYFNNNYLKLGEVKKRVDPHNFFKNEQSIPPVTA